MSGFRRDRIDRARPEADIAIRPTGLHGGRMKRLHVTVMVTASLVAASGAFAQSPRSSPVLGEQHEIITSYETARRGSDGSSGRSSGGNTLLESVIAVSDVGLELEYDLPQNATAEERARYWQYPTRVFRASDGDMRLLNAADLEANVDRWLASAGWTREVCGRWIFTWNAFRIECDPQSVVAEVEALDLRSVDLRDGATYRHPGTLGSGTLVRTDGPTGVSFAVSLPVDTDAVRRGRAESDVAIGEMMQQPVSLEDALRQRSGETITGTVEVTFDVNAAGNPTRRTVVTTLETVDAESVTETDRQTVTLERRLVASPTLTNSR